MHASTEELLLIKDGHPSIHESHVKGCSICQHKLSSIQSIQNDMQKMTSTAPTHLWKHIATQQQLNQQVRYSSQLMKMVYALAAVVFITVGLSTGLFLQQTQRQELLYDQMKKLIASSQNLENVIATRVNDSLRNEQIRRLKWRLQLIDEEMQMTNNDDIHHHISLWQDRIRTLQSMHVFLNEDYSTQQL